MPWLTSTDELPRHPCRVLIAGSTGAGKSTLARAVARQLKIDYFEIDALYHGPDWIPHQLGSPNGNIPPSKAGLQIELT
jgi:adenylylsulfate kinase-like enzyme